jgi:hypothetical protein
MFKVKSRFKYLYQTVEQNNPFKRVSHEYESEKSNKEN